MSNEKVRKEAKILIVEDEAIIGEDLKARIEDMGYRPLGLATSGEKALEQVRHEGPDLILMDVILAGRMDGIETAEVIRSSFDVPIVFITAYADPERFDRAKLTLPFGYLIKPFTDRELRVTIEMALYKAQIDAAHKRADEDRKLNEARLEALHALSQMREASLRDICDFALEQGVALTKSRYGYLSFANEEQTELEIHSWSAGVREKCRVPEQPMVFQAEAAGLWGEAFRQRKPIVTNDYSAPDPLKKGLPDGHVPVTRHMNVPVFDDGRIVVLAGVADKVEPYDETDVRQLRLLMEGMWRLIKRHQSEEALRKFEFIANACRDFMTLINRDYMYEAANRAYRQTLDPGRPDVVGRTVAEAWGREMFEDIIQGYLDQCFSGGEVRYESWFEFHGRGRGYYDVTYYPYFDESGRVTHAAVVSHETTAYKLAEEELRRSRRALDAIVRTVPDIIYRLDAEGRITFISDAIGAYGYAPEELIGRPLLDLVHPRAGRRHGTGSTSGGPGNGERCLLSSGC